MTNSLEQKLNFIPSPIRQLFITEGKLLRFPGKTKLIHEGEYVKGIPFVMEGLVKVVASFNDKELLLYYIKPVESCIMSFTSAIEKTPSQIIAITEEPTEVLMIPEKQFRNWTQKYSLINTLFFGLYQMRYQDLLDTIKQLVFTRLDDRILEYLRQKAALTKSQSIRIRHWQIADDLGTAREVVSRILRKLEHENHVRQYPGSIIELILH